MSLEHAFNTSVISSHPLSNKFQFNTAKTIGTSFVHSRLDFCNSLYYGLPKTQLNRLQHTKNSLARVVVAAPIRRWPHSQISPLVMGPERIEYKIASTTYKLLQYSSPLYLRDLITMQPSRSSRSSSVVTLLYPQLQSSLKVTNRSFRYSAPYLWNRLPPSLRLPCSSATSSGCFAFSGPVVGLSHLVFHSRLKTHLFSRSFTP